MIFLSDLCCYTQGDAGYAYGAADVFKGQSIQSLCDKYRQAVNPDVFVYSVNLNGHAQSQVRPGDDRTHLLSGWSEKLLGMIRELEAGKPGEDGQGVEVPVIEVLRGRYGR